MVRFLVFALVSSVLTISAKADIISSSSESLTPSSIDRLIRLVDVKKPGSSQLKVSLVITDEGMSTDVSPRYQVYLGIASLAETGNLSANFKITDRALRFISALRLKPGIFEIKFDEYVGSGRFEVTQTIDATQVFVDEQKQREKCADFCDGEIKSTVTVSEKIRKL